MSVFRLTPRGLALAMCLVPPPLSCASVGGSGSCPRGYEREQGGTCVIAGGYRADAYDDADATNIPPFDIGDALEHDVSVCIDPPTSGVVVLVGANPSGTDGERETIAFRVSDGRASSTRIDVYDAAGELQLSLHGATFGETPSPDGSITYVSGPLDFTVAPEGIDLVPGYASAFPCARTAGCLLNAGGTYALVACDETLLDTLEVPPLENGQLYGRCTSSPNANELVGAGSAGILESSGAGVLSWKDASFCSPPCDESAHPAFEFLALLPDPEGADEGREFFVLLGAPNTTVDGLRVEGLDGATGRAWMPSFELHGLSDERGRFIVGGTSVVERQQDLPGTLQNGPDGLRLMTCGGSVVERITWGDTTTAELHDAETRIEIATSGVASFHCGGGFWLTTSPEDALNHTNCDVD